MRTATLEARRIREVAREYERRGYEVRVHPKAASLPDFLADVSPDIVALGKMESVVIEVKSHESMMESGESLKRLAEAIEGRSGWRFELVVTNPKVSLDIPAASSIPASSALLNSLASAQRLWEEGYREPAFVLAWSVSEAALRKIASENQIASTRGTGETLKSLYSLGLIDRPTLDVLETSLPGRNALIHGFAAGPMDYETFLEILARARQLVLREESASSGAATL